MSEEIKKETPAPAPEEAQKEAAETAAEAETSAETKTAQGAGEANNEQQPDPPKPEEPKKEAPKKPDPEEARRIAHERAVAVVTEALKPEGPPDPLEPFFALCGHGSADEVRAALAGGISFDCRNHAGLTPLHKAVTNNTFAVVQCLVEAGADVNACGSGRFRDSILHSAIWTKDPRVIQLLLERGADPYALNSEGWTPLHLAAYHVRDPQILGLLVQSMKPVPAAPAKRYKGTLEYVDSWNRRAYQLVDGALVEHNLRRVGPGMFLGNLVIVQYHASTKSKASVDNLTLKAAEEAKAQSRQ
ncbi:MAG: ankyrin repeat domain-containing protein [Pyramidobacter sp.]|nr:ankyrin repeat domain-containing protein [Pyramidobacter sp.]